MSDTPLPLPNPPGSTGASVTPGSGQAATDQAASQPATQVAPATPPGATTASPAPIVYDDFAKVELRVGTVLEARPAPKGDKLLVLQVDLGTEKRQILAGIRQHVTPDEMIGRQIIVVANLAPRTMMGLQSQGMLLAATDPATGKVVIASPSQPVAPGSRVS